LPSHKTGFQRDALKIQFCNPVPFQFVAKKNLSTQVQKIGQTQRVLMWEAMNWRISQESRRFWYTAFDSRCILEAVLESDDPGFESQIDTDRKAEADGPNSNIISFTSNPGPVANTYWDGISADPLRTP